MLHAVALAPTASRSPLASRSCIALVPTTSHSALAPHYLTQCISSHYLTQCNSSLFTPRGAFIHCSVHCVCYLALCRYTSAVASLAKYLNSVTAFKGKVVVVTQPPGQKGCETVGAPNIRPSPTAATERDIKKPGFWYEGNPSTSITNGAGGQHYFGKLKHAERAWAEEFSKHAPRLKLTVLNITSMSEARADARVRDGACAHFCYPGVPHHWAEMLLRLVEQQVYGNEW